LVSLPRIDVVDEAIIGADPATVFKALIDEASGRTHWWMPRMELKPRGEQGQVGSVVDITVHRPGTTKFSERATEVIEGRSMKAEIFEGAFLGNGEWTFEPIDGKTKVRYRFNVIPHGLMLRILAPFINIGKIHSEVMQEGFRAMNHYLTQRQP
jgi:uncharacterized protein YndB with AHSA1/START domain